jgi:hypothetical protein
MDQDNLLIQNHHAKKGKAVVIGKPIMEEGLKKLFNITDTAARDKNANFLVQHNFKEYLQNKDVSILMLNMNIGVTIDLKSVLKNLEDINTVIKEIIEGMDDKTILAVTGNKAFNLKKEDIKLRRKFTHNDIVIGVNDEIEQDEGDPYTGLFFYSKRPTKYVYNYQKDDDLKQICPNPMKSNRIRRANKVDFSENDDSKSKKNNNINSGSSYLKFLNTFKSKISNLTL